MDENGHEIAFGWDRFGLSSRLTAAGQLTSATRGADGLVAEVSASVTGRVDRTVRREHDSLGRVTRVTYAKGEAETFAYDRWGRLSEHTRGSLKETYRYDHFGRLVERDENGTVFSYAYDAYGRRTRRTVCFADGGEALEERRAYDKYGRLVEIAAFGTSVKWRYDARGRVARQVVDGSPIDFAYTRDGRLAGKWLGGRESPDASVEYEYSRDGRIAARTANGVRQAFAYDARGQLVAVREGGADVERYAYDPAGNMVRKTIRGKTTTFTFDGANQLVSSTCDGVTTRYAYDAAGRLVREGDRTYRYGYLDKVLSVTDGKRSYTYAYHVDGQLARADYGDGGRVGVGDGGRAGSPLPAASEDFLWDGLALVRRGDEGFVNEPHVGDAPKKLRFGGKPRAKRSARRARKGPRGNPVVSSKGMTYFNDVLGTTVGVREGRGSSRLKSKCRYTAAALTAFGEPLQTQKGETSALLPSSFLPLPLFFTGKPQVEGLGRVFLYRNYRADLAKWQTADPLGYPDGWNQLAYCGSGVTEYVDLYGALQVVCNDINDMGAAKGLAEMLKPILGPKGEFSFAYGGYELIDGELVVHLNVGLFFDTRYKRSEDFENGEMTAYLPHQGGASDSVMINGVYEAAVAHERCHAASFYNKFRAKFQQYLYLNVVPYLTISSAEQIDNAIRSWYSKSLTEWIPISGNAANGGTYGWFLNRLGWQYLKKENGFTWWVKTKEAYE